MCHYHFLMCFTLLCFGYILANLHWEGEYIFRYKGRCLDAYVTRSSIIWR